MLVNDLQDAAQQEATKMIAMKMITTDSLVYA